MGVGVVRRALPVDVPRWHHNGAARVCMSPAEQKNIMMNEPAVADPTSTRRSWFTIGAADLVRSLGHWRVSHLMGLNEIQRRYARSRIGQFWSTILMGVMVRA